MLCYCVWYSILDLPLVVGEFFSRCQLTNSHANCSGHAIWVPRRESRTTENVFTWMLLHIEPLAILVVTHKGTNGRLTRHSLSDSKHDWTTSTLSISTTSTEISSPERVHNSYVHWFPGHMHMEFVLYNTCTIVQCTGKRLWPDCMDWLHVIYVHI